MARTTVVVMEDDLDGGAADQQVGFALDGVSYEIDLSNSNADRLRELLSLYISHGRRTGGRREKSPSKTGGTRAQWLAEVRTWARANGHAVADRGRVSQTIVDAYNTANG